MGQKRKGGNVLRGIYAFRLNKTETQQENCNMNEKNILIPYVVERTSTGERSYKSEAKRS